MKGLVAQIRSGDKRGIARAITLVENGDPKASEILRSIFPSTGRAFVVGIAGPPGTGKSTLVDKMIQEYRRRGKTVGVIAVDPTSPFTGGALLGDRVRMVGHSLDRGVYIRSMASRGELGGLAKATKDAIMILDASGKDYVLVETVGLGQTTVEVVKAVDATIVVLMPELGDEIQTIKAGIMEIGDIFVVNKADLGHADRTVLNLRTNLTSKDGWTPPVLKTVAHTGEGIADLLDSIEQLRSFVRSASFHAKKERERAQTDLIEALQHSLFERFIEDVKASREFSRYVEMVRRKEIDPHYAAQKLLRKIGVSGIEGKRQSPR